MLKKLSYKVKRLKDIEALQSAVFEYKFFDNNKIYDLNRCIRFLKKRSFTIYGDLETIVINKYGRDEDDKNSFEAKYVNILAVIFIFLFFLKHKRTQILNYNALHDIMINPIEDVNLIKDVIIPDYYSRGMMQDKEFQYIFRQLKYLTEIFSEFKILRKKELKNLSKDELLLMKLEDFLPDYTSTRTKPAFDALKSLSEEKAKPIEKLLKNYLKNKNDLINAMSTIYTDIDKIPENKLVHLVNEDKIIFQKLREALKCVSNNAKIRHGSKSSLTRIAIKELSIWFAYTATLLQKLLQNKI